MSLVNLGLHKKNGGDLVLFSRGVSKKIYKNPTTFPTPPVDQKTFDGQVNDLEETQIATFSGGATDTQLRDAKRAILVKSLNKLGFYVNLVSDGDVTIIHLAGMQARSAKTAQKTLLAMPLGLVIKTKAPGQVNLKWNKVPFAKNYEVMMCEDPVAGDWKHSTFNTQARSTIKGLKKSVEYWFKVMALGTNGINSPWSQTVSMVVY